MNKKFKEIKIKKVGINPWFFMNLFFLILIIFGLPANLIAGKYWLSAGSLALLCFYMIFIIIFIVEDNIFVEKYKTITVVK